MVSTTGGRRPSSPSRVRSWAVKAVPRLEIGSSRSATPVGRDEIVSAKARIGGKPAALYTRASSPAGLAPAGVPDALALTDQGPDLSGRRVVGQDVERAL